MKYFRLNKIYILWLPLILICISGCRKQYQWRDDYFLFGIVPYDCFDRDCADYYLLLNNKIYKDKMETGYSKGSSKLKKPYFKLFRESKDKVKMVQQLRDSIPLDLLNPSPTKSFGDFRMNFYTVIVELKVKGKVNTWYFSNQIDTTDAKLRDIRVFAGKVTLAWYELGKD